MPEPENLVSLTPGLPTYSQERAFLKVIQGVLYSNYRNMFEEIWGQVGTPQDSLDWTNPEEWIPLRLKGPEAALALKIWRETRGLVNPRHSRGCWYFSKKHELIVRDAGDKFVLTQSGTQFLEDPNWEGVAELDQKEGLLTLLQLVSEHSPGRRAEILPGYIEFCITYTKYLSNAVHKASLYDRLINLIERGLVKRRSTLYEITEAGQNHLEKYSNLIPGRSIVTAQTQLQKLIQGINIEARQHLTDHLAHMNPYKFEHLVKLLLQEMGYEEVNVTSPSNDGGVDVEANIELGISSIHEVVQVKRHAGVINRPVLDQLRGSLHRFNAMRGTIVTTGKFAAGAKKAAMEQGGAPVTLIDGEKLLDLLIEHEIGITKKTVDFLEFDDQKLIQFADDQDQLDGTEAT